MTRIAVYLYAVMIGLICVHPLRAGASSQPMGYNVTTSTYTEITGGTVRASGSAIEGYSDAISLPFSFNWVGTAYSEVMIHGDGYVSFGDGGDMPSALPAGGALISAWYNSLSGTSNGEIRTQTLGDSPNRVFVIQWKGATRAPQGSSNDVYNFQIRLRETDGRAEIVYGTMTITAAVGAFIGARSSSGESLCLTANYHHSTWTAPSSTMNDESVALQGWGPPSGTTYIVGAATSADAAVISLSSPTTKFNANTTQTIRVIVRNHGVNPMDSVEIHWRLNGVTRTTVRYFASPRIEPGETFEVTLGTATFNAGSFNTLEAWTRYPNGVNDQYPGNDMLVAYMAPRASGTLNIALAPNPNIFPSFRDCIRYLVTAGISGNVTVNVFSGNYNEQILVHPVNNSLAGGTVTFKNAANNAPTITWSPSKYPSGLYGLYESDYSQVTLLEGASAVFNGLRFTLANGLDHGGHFYGYNLGPVTIQNCRFTGPNNYLTMAEPTYAINLSGGAFEVSDNTISNMPMGIYLNGNSGNQDKISGNTITNCYEAGIFTYSNNVQIHKNTITGASGASIFYGIGVSGAGSVTANTITGNVSAQATSFGLGIEAVSVYGGSSTPHGLLIANNMILVGASGTSLGLVCQSDAQTATTSVLHNTVNIVGTSGTNGTAAYLLGITPMQIVNNIFHNYGTGNDGGYATFIEDYSSEGFISSMDFNNHMTTGTLVGYYAGDITRNTSGHPLTNWRTATGRDQNSSSVAVVFMGETDLHLKEIQSQLFGSSSTISTVSVDIDDENRLKPYMGADELKPRVVILESPQSRYACLGESVTLICVASVTPGATVVYQWYKDGVKLNGQTSNSLTIGSIGYPASGVYTCRVEATDGTSTTIVETEAASILVVRPTSMVLHPESQPVGIGGSVTLEVEAEAIGAPSDFVPKYQWKKRVWNSSISAYVDTNVVDNGRITGSKSNRLVINPIIAADTMDMYVCEVVGYCGTVVSRPARLFIPMIAASTSTPIACEGGPVNIECNVIPESVPGSTVSYRWYKGLTPLTDKPGVTGSGTKALRITNATPADAGTYTCVVTYDAIDVTLTSNPVDVEFGTQPVVTTQPLGDTLCEGQTLTLGASATGGGLRYQWRKGTTTIPGATGAQYTIDAVTPASSGSYTLVITNDCGSVTTEIAEILVIETARVTEHPRDVARYDGDSFSMSVTATGTPELTYQWYRNDTAIAGADQSTYTVDSATAEDHGTYYCIVTNHCGSDTSFTARASITVGVSGDVVLNGYKFGTAIPNPAEAAVRCEYTIPSYGVVRFTLTNAIGQEVAVLMNEALDAGTYLLQFNASELQLSPGVYNITMTAGNVVAVQQVVIVR